MFDARSYHAQETLKDGTPVTVRAIRPDDKGRLLEAFRNLERETIYTRFFAYKTALTDEELRRATEPDFEQAVALVVTLPKGDNEIIIAGARYVVLGARGNEGKSAEVAFTVEEDYQGQGLARRLLGHLATIARAKGVETFEAEVLPMNKPMLTVFARSGLPMTERREDGVVHLELSLGKA